MPPPAPTYPTLDAWIRAEAIPFSIESPTTLNAAVDAVIASLGDSVELLGFGEGLHGGEDILLLRNRLFQRLVEAHGYRAIAIESSFPRARVVNEYVAGRGAASYEAVQDSGFGYGFGRLDANRALVEWMRRYNVDSSHRVKLRFYAFDMPVGTDGPASPRQVLRAALDYLAASDPAGGRERRELIDRLLGPDARWENPLAWRDPEAAADLLAAAAALRIETEDLISELRVLRPELVAEGDRDGYLNAVQNAAVARQHLNFFVALARERGYSGALGVRDALMADNLVFVLDRERGRGKVLAFAHNAHLQRGKAFTQSGPDLSRWWPAGSHCDELFGSHYAVIGSAVGVSEANGIGRPEVGTIEARLTAAPGPARFIPTHCGQGIPAAEIAALPTRSGSTVNASYLGLTPQAFTNFDWLVVLDSTPYSRGGPLLHG